MISSNARPVPAKAGIGLRSTHFKEILNNNIQIPWLEIHSENFYAEGGIARNILDRISEKFPLSFHCVGLSLGSAQSINKEHLNKLKTLVDLYNPALVSDHISWSNFAGNTANDLLPIPYTNESLEIITNNIKHVQDILGRQILVENPSTYLEFKQNDMHEWEFINQLTDKADCALLLDINNIFVTCFNHKISTSTYLKNIDTTKIKEIHLAGFEEQLIDEETILIDTHGTKVTIDVWDLYRNLISKTGKLPTLIEWDTNIPKLDVLIGEMHKAQNILDEY